MHGFSALESINEKLNEELASQEEDEIDEDDAFDQAQKDVENVSDGQGHKESSENEQSQNSKNVDKTQHEGGENADSLDQQTKVSDEKMQKEVSDKILRSFYNSKYPDASHQIPSMQNVFQTLSDQAPQIASCLLTDIPQFSPSAPTTFDGTSAFVDSQVIDGLSG
jgi:hypothetical protein